MVGCKLRKWGCAGGSTSPLTSLRLLAAFVGEQPVGGVRSLRFVEQLPCLVAQIGERCHGSQAGPILGGQGRTKCGWVGHQQAEEGEVVEVALRTWIARRGRGFEDDRAEEVRARYEGTARTVEDRQPFATSQRLCATGDLHRHSGAGRPDRSPMPETFRHEDVDAGVSPREAMGDVVGADADGREAERVKGSHELRHRRRPHSSVDHSIEVLTGAVGCPTRL